MQVETRHVDDQLVLTQRGYVSQETIGEWIRSVGDGSFARASKFGGIAGPEFIIYFGAVRPGQSAAVENCIPIAAGQPVPPEEAPRIEPAHSEVYARLPLKMCQFPEILQGYDAVNAWIRDNYAEQIGPAREIYFGDFVTAGPDDDVVDIAIPIK